jgi:hypothetical protein
MNRAQVVSALSCHYSKKFGGNVRSGFDEAKRAYYIRGESLPAAKELQHLYPNGWSLLDFIKPTRARVLVAQEQTA